MTKKSYEDTAIRSNRWFVVQTHSRKEERAIQNLRNQGLDVFCPYQSKVRQVGRSYVTVMMPFFPGYVFVSLDLGQDSWHFINGTYCVNKLVAFGAGQNAIPAPVPVGLVEQFKALSSPSGELKFAEPLSSGDHVQVIGGAFANMNGVLERTSGAERVIVLMNILAQETRVSLKRNELMLFKG